MKRLYAVVSLAAMFALGFAPFAACGAANGGSAELPREEEPTPEIPEIPEEPVVEIPEIPEEPVVEIPEIPEEPEVPEEPLPKKTQYVRILTDGLNVRSGAGTGYASLGQVEKGILMKYAGKSGNWYETLYRGQTAYVSADSRYTALSELDPAEEKIEKVIEEGLLRIGVPYVYGATRLHDGRGNLLKGFTTSQFDCSSLMQYIFYKGAGTLLDVTTRTQIKQGKAVAKSDIQRGDLLFFTNASRYHNTGIERVGHVALYLGDNYILHTASDYAKVEQISSQRWGYFLEARRVI